jgi:DNA-binding PadR family transcriptional regulator
MNPGEDHGRGLPRSYLRPLLLAELAFGPAHGYELLEQVRDDGLRIVDAGGLYRTLRTMEHDGVVASWWETSQSGPPRRTYELTASGLEALAAEERELRATIRLLTELVERIENVIPPTARSTM